MGALAEGWQTSQSAPSSRRTMTGIRSDPDHLKATRGAPHPARRSNSSWDEDGRTPRGDLGGKPTTEKSPEKSPSRNRICIPKVHLHLIPPTRELDSIVIRHAGTFVPEPLCSYSLIQRKVSKEVRERIVHGMRNLKSHTSR